MKDQKEDVRNAIRLAKKHFDLKEDLHGTHKWLLFFKDKNEDAAVNATNSTNATNDTREDVNQTKHWDAFMRDGMEDMAPHNGTNSTHHSNSSKDAVEDGKTSRMMHHMRRDAMEDISNIKHTYRVITDNQEDSKQINMTSNANNHHSHHMNLQRHHQM